jgi:hypothetical protein
VRTINFIIFSSAAQKEESYLKEELLKQKFIVSSVIVNGALIKEALDHYEQNALRW